MTGLKYQVALSFAGEHRVYVEEVARHLQSRSIDVFYDGFEQVGLWGQSGAEAFHEAFAQESAYVVMFISEAYVSKAWPIHEKRSALSRMIEKWDKYILPVRFDDTPVPGLPTDVTTAPELLRRSTSRRHPQLVIHPLFPPTPLPTHPSLRGPPNNL